MMCTGFVTSYHGLLAARWFLGITEAGLYRKWLSVQNSKSHLCADTRQPVCNITCPAGTDALNLV